MKAIFADKRHIEIDSTSEWVDIDSNKKYLAIRSEKEFDLDKVSDIVKNNSSKLTIESGSSSDEYVDYIVTNISVYNNDGSKMLEIKLETE